MAPLFLARSVVLIAGASTGIGAALAVRLAEQFPGIGLVLAARRQPKLEAIAERCRQAGALVLAVPINLAEVEQIPRLVEQALEQFGRVDALVNNAGFGQMGPLELMTPTAAQEQFAVNFHAPLFLSQALIPTLRQQGGGRIINISSLGGRMAFPAGGLYSASKFALEAMSDVLRMELRAFNIWVSVVEPGPVKTEFLAIAKEKIRQLVAAPESSLYAPALKKIEELETQTARLGWPPERVAQVIIQALQARRPRPRYVAATGGTFFLFLMTKLLPTGVTDAFWKRFYGIDRVARQWQQQQPLP